MSSNSSNTNNRVHTRYVESRKPRAKYVRKNTNQSEVASSSSKPSLSSGHTGGGQRRHVVNRTVNRFEHRKALAIIKKKYNNLPEGAEVTDVGGSLAKIHVPYGDNSPIAHLWRGAIVDYTVPSVIKTGSMSAVVHVADDALLADLEEAQPVNSNNTFYFSPVFDGAVVSIFKYKGQLYFSTGRSLGTRKPLHPGALDIKEAVINMLPERFLEDAFPEDAHSVVYHYDFILLHKSTLDVTQADIALPALIFLGRYNLNNVSGSPRSVTFEEGQELSETRLFPDQPGFYKSTAEVSMEVAQSYMSGEVTGYPEAVVAVEKDKTTGRIKRMVRFQPESVSTRHKIRGDVALVLTRLTQLIANYDFVDGTLYPLDPRDPVIVIGGDDMLESLRAALHTSMPASRAEDVDQAYLLLDDLIDKVSHFFTTRGNNRHPAAEYWNVAHTYKTQDERRLAVLRMDQDTLFNSARWYKLFKN